METSKERKGGRKGKQKEAKKGRKIVGKDRERKNFKIFSKEILHHFSYLVIIICDIK